MNDALLHVVKLEMPDTTCVYFLHRGPDHARAVVHRVLGDFVDRTGEERARLLYKEKAAEITLLSMEQKDFDRIPKEQIVS